MDEIENLKKLYDQLIEATQRYGDEFSARGYDDEATKNARSEAVKLNAEIKRIRESVEKEWEEAVDKEEQLRKAQRNVILGSKEYAELDEQLKSASAKSKESFEKMSKMCTAESRYTDYVHKKGEFAPKVAEGENKPDSEQEKIEGKNNSEPEQEEAEVENNSEQEQEEAEVENNSELEQAETEEEKPKAIRKRKKISRCT